MRMNNVMGHNSIMFRGIVLIATAWVIQALLLVPMALWGIYLSEEAPPFFVDTYIGMLIAFGAYYFFTLMPSLLVIFSARALSFKISKKFERLQFLQPSIFLGVVLALSGPGGLSFGVMLAATGYVNIFIVSTLMRWLDMDCSTKGRATGPRSMTG